MRTFSKQKNNIVWFIIVCIGIAAIFIAKDWEYLDAVISNGANAENVIGQLDSNGAITYTQQTINGGVTSTGFSSPAGVAVDEKHRRLYVSDTNNSRILVYDLNPSNELVDYTPDAVLGQTNFTASDPNISSSALSNPTGLLFVSSTNRLFVSDTGNNRVLAYDVSAITSGQAAVSVLGAADFDTFGCCEASTSSLSSPRGLAYDDSRNLLFVVDSEYHRVMVFNVSVIDNGEDAVNVLGQTNFNDSEQAFSGTTSTLSNPYYADFASTSDRLFVSDRNNNRIMIFDVSTITNGEEAINVLGQDDFVSNNSQTTQDGFNSPEGLLFRESDQYLFVSDNSNSRILVFDVSTSTIANGQNALNVLGQADFNTTGESTATSTLNFPGGLSYATSTGDLYVADQSNNRVMVFNVSVIDDGEDAVNVVGQVVNGTISFSRGRENNWPIATGMYTPDDAAIDVVNNRLFVADTVNHRVLVFNLDPVTKAVTDYQPDAVLGQPDFTTGQSSNSSSGLNNPQGLLYDSVNNRLFVSEFENSRIYIFDVSDITNGESAVNVLGQAGLGISGAGTSSSTLSNPSRMAYDSVEDRLFVADASNNRIMIFNIAEITNGEGAINVLGQADFDSSFNEDTNLNMSTPRDVAYDPDTNYLYVADYGQNRVLVFDVSTSTISNGQNAINVLGQADLTGTEGGTSSTTVFNPWGLHLDPIYNRLFVAEEGNSRVVVFDVTAITNGEAAVNVLGAADFDIAGGGIGQDTLNGPAGMFYVTSTGDLYVADRANNRVMVFDAASANSTSTLSINSAVQKTDGTGVADISVNVSDVDSDTVRLSLAYASQVGGSCGDDETFSGDPTLNESSATVTTSVGTAPDIENDNTYQVGTVSGIDTSSTNTVQFDWNSATDLAGAAGSYCLRITPYDYLDATAAYASVTIDNIAPTAPGSLSVSASGTTSMVLTFGATSTETNFTDYRIFYTEGSSGVTVNDSSLTSSSDSNLGSITYNGASTTTLPGLSANTQYVTNIWAFDSYGSSASGSTELSFYTLANAPSLVEGAAGSSSQITVTWNVNGNPSGTEFQADIDTGTDCAYTADATSCVFSGLSANTTYTITVSARNGDGVAASAGAIQVTTSAASGGGSAPIASSHQETAVRINGGADTTDDPVVNVSLSALLATAVALSEDPTFSSATFVAYQPIVPFTLSSGHGEKTVYVRFRSYSGFFTTDASDSITLVSVSTTPSSEQTETSDDGDTEPSDTGDSPGESIGQRGEDTTSVACVLSSGAYKIDEAPAVYFVTDHCTKRPFQRSDVYFSYYISWADTTSVSSTTLDSIPDDSLGFMPWGVLWSPPYAPLVKTNDDPKVYIVSNNQRRWIQAEEIFHALGYRFSWVEDVSAAWLAQYPEGNPIVTSETHPAGTLIKYPNAPEVYLLQEENNQLVKRQIVNETVFAGGGLRIDRVITIPETETYPDGEEIR